MEWISFQKGMPDRWAEQKYGVVVINPSSNPQLLTGTAVPKRMLGTQHHLPASEAKSMQAISFNVSVGGFDQQSP